MGNFDLFAGKLRCPKCGTITEDDSTNLQTKIQRSPNGAVLRVGDKIDIDFGNEEASGYILFKKPMKRDSFKLIDYWECPHCGEPYNWALIEIEDSKITNIHEVALSEYQISGINYISNECGLGGWKVSEGKVKFIG